MWIEGLKNAYKDTKNCASCGVEHKGGDSVQWGHFIINLLMEFTHNLRELFLPAILRIGRYLMPKKGEGIIFRP